jgi:hypothetical protein
MKKIVFILVLVMSTLGLYAQSLNSYKYAIVPTKFQWQSRDNQHRLSTLTKALFSEAGFTVFYDNEQLPVDVASDRCNKVYVDVDNVSSLLNIKLEIVIRDCTNKEIFRSKAGTSKEKNFETAYHASLRQAFGSIAASGYRYDRPVNTSSKTDVAVKISEKPSTNTVSGYTVEEVSTGFLIIETSTSTIVLKLQRTDKPDHYIASSRGRNGTAYKSGNAIVFDYYEGDQLRSETFNVQLN